MPLRTGTKQATPRGQKKQGHEQGEATATTYCFLHIDCLQRLPSFKVNIDPA
jgi:hypothetical protein